LPRKRRLTAGSDRRKLSEARVVSSLESLSQGMIPRLAELETELMAKYEIAWASERTEAALHHMSELFGEDARVSLVRADGLIRGFAVVVRFQDAWYALRAGFDYAFQQRLPLYFEVMYYRLAEEAEKAGVTSIHYGLGSEEAKRSRGCSATLQYSFIRPLNS
jgi:hypothetical protein